VAFNNKKTYLAGFVVALVILFVLGFRIVHPQAGLSSAMGSAQSSVMIVKKADTYKSGDKIVAHAQVGKSPVLGIVAGTTDGSIELILDNGVARSTPDKVHGKLMIVIPFIGAVLGLVGL
jgi:hypothetical protein